MLVLLGFLASRPGGETIQHLGLAAAVEGNVAAAFDGDPSVVQVVAEVLAVVAVRGHGCWDCWNEGDGGEYVHDAVSGPGVHAGAWGFRRR